MNANDIVASDGYRLAIYKSKVKLPTDAYIRRDVFKALKLLLPITENVEIYTTEDYTVFVGLKQGVKVFEVYSDNTSGDYPNYHEVIKDLRFNHVFKFDRNAFVKLLKKTKNAEVVIMRITDNNALLEFQTEDSKIRKQINIENLTNSNLNIAFNLKFLREGLEAIDGKYVEMKAIDNESITQFNNSDNSFTYYVMPVKIKEV
jgi:DNA polymerase sliding clamp subunit (PCNA homolog)